MTPTIPPPDESFSFCHDVSYDIKVNDINLISFFQPADDFRRMSPTWETSIQTGTHRSMYVLPKIIVLNWANPVQEIMVLSPKHKTKIPALHKDDFLPYGSKVIESTHPTLPSFILILWCQRVNISDFERLRAIGRQTGTSFTLIQKRDDNQVYALKTFQRTAKERSTPSEYSCIKSIQQLLSPFLPKVQWDLQDEDSFYLVLVRIYASYFSG